MNNKSDIKERRLKSIYDALDSGNNKKAIQEADKVLKKDANCTCARALRALALYRNGKSADAASLIDTLFNAQPTDESTLQAMSYYYRESYQLERIAQLYEAASKKAPQSEDLLSTLFMAYVRVLDHKNQQRIAMRLHKLAPSKNPYYFWAVMSTVMQGLEAGPEQSAKLYLPLAEKMVSKYLDEGKLQADAEAQLYLLILEQLGKWSDALTALNSVSLKSLIPESTQPSVPRMKLYYLERLGSSRQVAQLCKQLLREEPDEWQLWLKYVKFGLRALKEEKNEDEEVVEDMDKSLDDMFSFMTELQYDEAARARAPRLAELHLIQEADIKDEHKDRLLDLFAEYFQRFKRRPITATDLLPYLHLLLDEGVKQLRELVSRCEQVVPEVECEEDASVSLDTVYSHLNLEQLRRSALGAATPDMREDRLQHLCHLHKLSYQKHLLRTEYQPQDGFLLLVVEEMYDAWMEEGCDKWLWRSVATLESGLRSSPSNHYIMIRLLKLYGTLGAFQPALRLFERMEVKQIMCDSSGYLVSRLATRLGQFSNATALLNNFSKFFKISRKDVTEYLTTAYRTGSFRKVPEFVGLSARLASSLESAFCQIELRCLHLLMTAIGGVDTADRFRETIRELGCDPTVEPVTVADLRDNRDLDIVPCFEPVQCRLKRGLLEPETQREADKAAELRWLRFRCLLLRSLSCIAQPMSSENKDCAENLAQQWEQLMTGHVVLPASVSECASPIRSCPHPTRPNSCPLQLYLLGPESEDSEDSRQSGSMACLAAVALKFVVKVTDSRPPADELVEPLLVQVRRLRTRQEVDQQSGRVVDMSHVLPWISCLVESTLLMIHTAAVSQKLVQSTGKGRASRTDHEWCQNLQKVVYSAVIDAAGLAATVCERFSELHLVKTADSKLEEDQLAEDLSRQLSLDEESDRTDLGKLIEAARQAVADSQAASMAELRRVLESCLPPSARSNDQRNNGH